MNSAPLKPIIIKPSVLRKIKVCLTGLHLPYIHRCTLIQVSLRQLILCDGVKRGFGGIVQLAVQIAVV